MTSEKRIDEGWKEQVEREKRLHHGSGSVRPEPAAPSFDSAQDRLRQDQGARPSRRTNVTADRHGAHRSDFGLFLSSLSMQALIALGEAAHPATGQPQEDLEQARYLIDILGLLQEKTKGNLTAEEASLLDGLLYELRMKYVAREKQ